MFFNFLNRAHCITRNWAAKAVMTLQSMMRRQAIARGVGSTMQSGRVNRFASFVFDKSYNLQVRFIPL